MGRESRLIKPRKVRNTNKDIILRSTANGIKILTSKRNSKRIITSRYDEINRVYKELTRLDEYK